MSSLKAPKQLLEDLDKVRWRFLWAGDSEFSGAKCKVGWSHMTKPVQFGGHGLKIVLVVVFLEQPRMTVGRYAVAS